jgi:hypothetical protein
MLAPARIEALFDFIRIANPHRGAVRCAAAKFAARDAKNLVSRFRAIDHNVA